MNLKFTYEMTEINYCFIYLYNYKAAYAAQVSGMRFYIIIMKKE